MNDGLIHVILRNEHGATKRPARSRVCDGRRVRLADHDRAIVAVGTNASVTAVN